MKFPVGLGVRWFRVPFMTIALAALLVASQMLAPISGEREEYVQAPQDLLNSHEIISYQFCMVKMADTKVCNQIFLQESKVKSDANVRKEWLEKSMSAFESDSKVLRDLPQFQRFNDQVKRAQGDYGKRKGRQYLNADNYQPSALIGSLFRHGNLAHLVINVGLLLILGASVELWMGPTLFLFTYLLGGFFTAAAYTRFAAPMGIEVFGSSGSLGVLMGMFTVFFSKSRLRFVHIPLSGSSFTTYMSVEKGLPLVVAAVELLAWACLIPSGAASFGIYFLGGFLGLVLGMACWMIMRPNFQSLFPASAILFREINWTRLSEFDLKLIEDAIRYDPDFVDLRLKYIRSLDAVLTKEPRNREINFRRLRLVERIGRDWHCHLTDPEVRRKTAATMEKLSLAFPWRVLLYSTSSDQAHALNSALMESGVGVPIQSFLRP